MPNPARPPFYPGAVINPRTVNRWLDVNPQGGALTRAKAFIELPSFTANNNWDGYSNIVTAFNFEAPNGFSIPCDKVVAEKTLPVLVVVKEVIVYVTLPTPTPDDENVSGIAGGEGGGIIV